MRNLEPRTETVLTEDRIPLIELVEEQVDAYVERERLAIAADRIPEAEV